MNLLPDCVSVHHVHALRSWKASDALELELHAVVNCQMGVRKWTQVLWKNKQCFCFVCFVSQAEAVLGRWHNCSWYRQTETRSTKRKQINKDTFLVTIAYSRPPSWAFSSFSVPHVSRFPPLYKPILCAASHTSAQNQQNKVPKM